MNPEIALALAKSYVKQTLEGAGALKGADGIGILSIEQTVTSEEDGGTNKMTVTLTDGSTFTFAVNNGNKGDSGSKGDKGDPFAVAKTYTSVAEMNADFSNADVAEGSFVVITSTTEDEDNAKLYIKGATGYAFVTDMSGIQGIKGDAGTDGKDGQDGITPHIGENNSWWIGETDTGVKAKGEDGKDGKDGIGIASIERTDGDGSAGTTDTYTITMTDDSTTQFTVYNGKDGADGEGGSGGQAEIKVNGILKGDGTGNVTAAVAGVDYVLPSNSGEGATGFYPEIIVYVETGAEVVITNGVSTFSGTSENGVFASCVNAYGSWDVTATLGDNSLTKTVDITAVKQYEVSMMRLMAGEHIYGVEWDGTSATTLNRTDEASEFADPVPYVLGATEYSSPFDNLYPWSDMSIVSDIEAGELVAIPKFWYKWTKTGSAMKLQIATYAAEDFSVSPAHRNRNDGYGERDVIYVGRYPCDGGFKSNSGTMPISSVTLDVARTTIASLGEEIWQTDFSILWTIRLLYLVEFANWNSQAVIGYGGGTTAIEVTGSTDTMPYHTGTMQTSRDTAGVGLQYRHIESLWDNVRYFVDGVTLGNPCRIVDNPAIFGTTGISIGATFKDNSTGATIKAFGIPSVSGFEWALYPSETGGTASTYITDGFYQSTSSPIMTAGGYYDSNTITGMFYSSNSTGSAAVNLGCRLMKLPKD